MKTLMISAAVALAALSGAASAMTVSDGQIATVQRYASGADVSALSYADIQSLLDYIHSGASEGEKLSYVRSALN